MSTQDIDHQMLRDGAEQAADDQDGHGAVAGVNLDGENNWAAQNPMKEVIPT